MPPNGLVVYTGTILTEEGKERKVNIDFEPFKPINTSLYLCDNKFHTEALNELLESDSKCALTLITPPPPSGPLPGLTLPPHLTPCTCPDHHPQHLAYL